MEEIPSPPSQQSFLKAFYILHSQASPSLRFTHFLPSNPSFFFTLLIPSPNKISLNPHQLPPNRRGHFKKGKKRK